ncbi:MAG: hypothetical protein FNT29_07110 [Halothiobacillaceae bacterium]|nr:MAG: hypothetical protein FNT29_07110 [Halothiobacillaceae bacterium]
MRLSIPLLTLALCSSALHAQAAEPVPTRGQSMQTVLQQYGEPQERLAAVGKPPITRWVYPGFTVYFERRWTIHAVPHRPRHAAPPAAH